MAAIQQLHRGATLSEAAERRIFSGLRLVDGIFKTTEARRLADVDELTVEALRRAGPVEVIDVGASSGTTSLELLEALGAAGHDARLLLTDVALTADLVPVHRGYGVLLDRSGYLLQHLVLGMPLRPWRRRLDMVTQMWLPVALANRWYARQKALGRIKPGDTASSILLVAPNAAAHPAITCKEGDVFASPPADQVGRFDVVRAANLLIPGVFSPERITLALGHLQSRLRGPGALLVLARSPAPGHAGSNQATIYRLSGSGRLEVAARVGAGSDIEPLVGT